MWITSMAAGTSPEEYLQRLQFIADEKGAGCAAQSQGLRGRSVPDGRKGKDQVSARSRWSRAQYL